jgi:hypothetical protein
MRPQDIVILLKLLTIEKADWQYRELSSSLFISTSEVSESLKRSQLAGLIDSSRKKVYRQNLMEFIEHGLHYVFPQQPGSMVTGIATAHSHPFYQSLFISDVNYVWEDENGTMRGLAIEPLYKGVVRAVKKDEALYKILASIDIIRVGKTRELKAARQELQNAILHA